MAHVFSPRHVLFGYWYGFILHGTYYLGIGMGHVFSPRHVLFGYWYGSCFLHGMYYLGIGMAHVFFSMARTI